MKNKYLIIIVIILLNFVSVYMIGQSILAGDSKYEDALKEARKFVEKNLYSKAIEQYQAVIGIKDTINARIEMIDAYEKGLKNGEFDNQYEIQSQVFDIVDSHRKESKAYEYAGRFFYNLEDYEDCVTVLKQADKLRVGSKKIDELLEKVRYKYDISFSMYTDVKPIYEGKYTLKENDKYRYADTTVSSVVGSQYDYASSFSEGKAFIKKGNYTFLINEKGQREVYFDNKIESCSGVGSNLLACRENKVYKYYGIDGKYKFGNYEFAGRFRNDIAAVRENGKWRLINPKGKYINNMEYEDIKLNEFEECAVRGRIFAKSSGKYRMYDLDMKQIGDFQCDDVKLFVDSWSAFKKEDKWGYINNKVEVVIKPQYENAKSFSCGFAGVKINGYWKMINEKNSVVIDDEFEDVDYMNNKGICFVKQGGYWKQILMYYWN